jgi:hypothetical protein
MHAVAIFVVEAHLNELREDFLRHTHARRPVGPNRFQRVVGALRRSAVQQQEPIVPKLESYPYPQN